MTPSFIISAVLVNEFLLTRLLRGVTYTICNGIGKDRFLLTRLLRGVTRTTGRSNHTILFLLTRLLRGVTVVGLPGIHVEAISTHTPLARRDLHEAFYGVIRSNFYSHASCEA